MDQAEGVGGYDIEDGDDDLEALAPEALAPVFVHGISGDSHFSPFLQQTLHIRTRRSWRAGRLASPPTRRFTKAEKASWPASNFAPQREANETRSEYDDRLTHVARKGPFAKACGTVESVRSRINCVKAVGPSVLRQSHRLRPTLDPIVRTHLIRLYFGHFEAFSDCVLAVGSSVSSQSDQGTVDGDGPDLSFLIDEEAPAIDTSSISAPVTASTPATANKNKKGKAAEAIPASHTPAPIAGTSGSRAPRPHVETDSLPSSSVPPRRPVITFDRWSVEQLLRS
ncbi:hypothetical protein B0H13DRAFT_1879290 [Mycena leptocephala]|nr:hypothetical protein B0H13DRAFT_1879290 [Mycena leptocephala]